MIVHVNGRFYGQPTTGVQRYGREVLAALDGRIVERGLPAGISDVVLHVPRRHGSSVPPLRAVRVARHGIARGHLWEQLDLPLHVRGGVLFCPGNTAPIPTLLGRTPVVVTIHDLSFRYFPAAYSAAFRLWYQLITPLVARRASRIITVSESERAALTAAYPSAADRVIAIQNGGAPLAPDATTAQPPTTSPYVLYVGSLSHRKNLPGVLAAFGRLARRYPDLRLVVAGGTSAVFARRAPMPPPEVRDRILWLGQVEDPAILAGAYRGARCLVFPSFYEASPLPPLEAMAYGCPVVAAEIPSLRERCGEAALYCAPVDPDAIARAVARILDDATLAAELREAGAARAAQFSWRVCAERTLEVLEEVAARARR